MKSLLTILLTSLVPLTATAQLGLEGFTSGRYEVRNSAKSSRSPASQEETQVVTDSDGIKVRTLKESELAAEKKAREAEEKRLQAEREKALKAEEEAKAKAAAAVAVVPTPAVVEKSADIQPEVQEPSISAQAESLFSNKANEIYDFYREQVHPDDIRNNKVEIEFAPVAAYNESQSNYSYRDYQSYFNALKFRANVWFTPLIGVSGQILFSFAADVDSLEADRSRVSAKYEMVDLSLNFRRFFGVSRRASSFEYSILLSDNKFNVPSDNNSRARLKSQGLGVGLKARIPTSTTYAWTVAGTFFPRLQHSEDATGVTIKSGSHEESIRLGLELGGEWKFDRENQMIWGLGVSAEKNQFDGAAGLVDPSSGQTPSNVGVSNSMYMFSLGYRWGH